ncbi:MAG: zinc-ribbon domain containing protein [Chloroflexota bacterium]|nr:zinc-ribbon domain containing protein [Dehalococcoidia bacterium]MDW8254293.1 zinc-ribbon domain containing protein [Chloroflexota bacterium]
MRDKTLTCRDCGTTFLFTEGEQTFYASKGLTNDPSRCPECRAERKRARSEGGYASSGSYHSGYGSSYSSGNYDRRARTMHPATCSACGKETEVPFQPRGDRPVYCSSCYERRSTSFSSSGRSNGRSNRGRW